MSVLSTSGIITFVVFALIGMALALILNKNR